MTILSLQGITKRFGSLSAVQNLDLHVADGELLALLGPSGCGKTTVLRMIAGLSRPDEGEICFDHASVLHLPPEKRQAVMVFQRPALFPYRSVGENVAFGLRLRPELDQQMIRQKVEDGLAAVQLSGYAERRPHELSGGQQQRVALARALVLEPRLLLLDEPLSSLDRGLREEMQEMIRSLQKRFGLTTLFVTHDQAEAVAVADQIALMLDGSVRQVGPPRSFFESPCDTKTARFFNGTNFLSGEIKDNRFETEIGCLTLLDGVNRSAEGMIRPNFIEIEEDAAPESDRPNRLIGKIIESRYGGESIELRVRVNETDLTVQAPLTGRWPVGDRIRLSIPPERIWIFPHQDDVKRDKN